VLCKSNYVIPSLLLFISSITLSPSIVFAQDSNIPCSHFSAGGAWQVAYFHIERHMPSDLYFERV
jgi:hypothetical protein